jgi:hypothetical protein
MKIKSHKTEGAAAVACSDLLGHVIVITQNLGKQIQTVQSRQATKPALASLRCERRKTSEQRNARTPPTTPASNATRALVCEAKWSVPAKSSNQQIAVKVIK